MNLLQYTCLYRLTDKDITFLSGCRIKDKNIMRLVIVAGSFCLACLFCLEHDIEIKIGKKN